MLRKSPLSVLDYALRLLDCRHYSVADLKANLKTQKYSLYEIEETISELERTGVLNDDLWLENKLLDMKNLRPRSLLLMKIKLREKGIDPEQTEAKWRELGLDELELARVAAERKTRVLKTKTSQNRERLIRHLASRGFGWDVIKKVVEDFNLQEIAHE